MIPKFRAFIIETEKLQEVWKMRFYETEELYINEYYGQDFILMQSTGVYDKHGVEIFEGDIVKFKDELYQIEFKSYRFKAKDFWLTYQDVPDDFFSEVAYKQCEVIGNVHENPELLGDRK